MIEITPSLTIDDSEIQLDFVRASGPGGQNVNKVSTAVQLRFDVRGSPSLPPEIKQRLERLAGSRLTAEGVLVIESRQYRTQEQNRQAALDRLADLVRSAAQPPKPRRPTRPSLASKQQRLEGKRRRAETKRLRSQKPGHEE